MPAITNVVWATKKDIIPRYASGGNGGYGTGTATNCLLGPYASRSDISPNSNALIWAGSTGANLALGTASPYLQVLSSGILCSITPVVDSTYFWQFCGRDNLDILPTAMSANQVAQRNVYHPPVTLGPGASFLLYLACGGQGSVASAFEVEIGHIER